MNLVFCFNLFFSPGGGRSRPSFFTFSVFLLNFLLLLREIFAENTNAAFATYENLLLPSLMFCFRSGELKMKVVPVPDPR